MSWRHPQIGLIDPLRKSHQPKKLWKHFYDEAEHWERLCEVDISLLRDKAESILNVRRNERRELSLVSHSFQEHAQQVHDEHYGRVYMAQMSDSETRWSMMDKRYRHHALTPYSIFITVALEEPQSVVITAFRPLPKVHGINMSEEQIAEQANLYFENRVFMNIHRLNELTLRMFSHHTTTPQDIESLWSLTLAMGQAQLLRTPEIRQAVSKAQVLLAQVPDHVVSALVDALDWQACLDQMICALETESLEEMEDALVQAQALLMVAPLLGAQQQATDFVDDAKMVIAWVPASWSILAEHAASRREHFEQQNQILFEMWSFVEQTIWEATLRYQTPSIRPKASIAYALVDASARPEWLQQLSQWFRSMSDQFKKSLEQLATLELTPTSPMMGSENVAEKTIEVRVQLNQPHSYFKAFVVDESRPGGVDVTANVASDGLIWMLDDTEDRAVFLLFTSTSPIRGSHLSEICDEVLVRNDVAISSAYIAPDIDEHGTEI